MRGINWDDGSKGVRLSVSERVTTEKLWKIGLLMPSTWVHINLAAFLVVILSETSKLGWQEWIGMNNERVSDCWNYDKEILVQHSEGKKSKITNNYKWGDSAIGGV